VVEDARAGIFVPPGDPTKLADAIRNLADHIELGREMGLRGRAHIEAHFDRAELAARLERIITAMVSSEA